MGIAQNWRLRKERYRLVGEICDDCGLKMFPPRDVCPRCPISMNGNGREHGLKLDSTAPIIVVLQHRGMVEERV